MDYELVWPLTALFGGLLWLAGYFVWGRPRPDEDDSENPFPVMVATGSSHCGAGCTLGDIIAQWLAFGVPLGRGLVRLAQSVSKSGCFAVWVLDFLVAFGLGIAFQYFTIVPMRGLSPVRDGLIAAFKADVLSISRVAGGHVRLHGVRAIGLVPVAYGGGGTVIRPSFGSRCSSRCSAGFSRPIRSTGR